MSNIKMKISDFGNADKNKFLEVKNNQYFIEEYTIVTEIMKFGIDYYKHIIHNVNIDRQNPNNSYIMWIVGKVDKIDKDKPTKIIPAKSSLPDIDIDVPSYGRDEIISYLKTKYGKDNVAQMVTFQRMKGGNALKVVIRTMTQMGFDEINEITKQLIAESKITADLEEMKNKLGYKSVIQWGLENTPEKFSQYCEIIDGKYDGILSKEFELAIQLEGAIYAQSKHAAGVVISKYPLNEICPIIHDKDGEVVAGFEMDNLADIGITKFDILGLKLLDKITFVRDFLHASN